MCCLSHRFSLMRYAQALIAKGADTNAVEKGSHTPLILAAYLGATAACEALLAGGANINAVRGYTALDYALNLKTGTPAAGYSYAATIELLVAKGGKAQNMGHLL